MIIIIYNYNIYITNDSIYNTNSIALIEKKNYRVSLALETEQGTAVDVAAGGLSGQEIGTDKVIVTNMRSLTRLISDMSKYTILFLVAICTSFIFTILFAIIVRGVDGNEFLIQKYAMFPFAIDNFLNCVALVLQFHSFKKYYKLICNKCHIKCEDRYTKETNKQNDDLIQRLPSRELGFNANGTQTPPLNDFKPVTENGNTDGMDLDDIATVAGDPGDITLVAQKSTETLHV